MAGCARECMQRVPRLGEKMAIGNIGTGNTSTLATLTTFDCRAMQNPHWDESLRGAL